MMMPENHLPTLYAAADLNLQLPDAKDLITPEDASRTRELIREGGAYTPAGQALQATKGVAQYLGTDSAGAKKFYNDLPNEDKVQNGNVRYVTHSALNKEVSRRIQEPRDVYKLERLKDAEACLNAFRDHPELEKRRLLAESKIRRELPKLKQKMLKAENITNCQVSGEPLQPDAEVHHIERQADQPHKSLEPANLLLINKPPHREIHDAAAHSPDALASLALEKKWPYKPRT
ncbi:hypothetical protein [Bordetella sp. LUAb4]|uniref:hypothetical protein n=1 Tax=Bordetella sp. LUAb4 TaxID=2843195 RepID=UPI001E4B26BD|nr:hypothetical protein [Bordetella sp. LUAb4]